ncbi:hypothetical protein PIB30_071622 [Stylosanthes scabra]|uniref:Uncharacterized protein n=1 Tax=Stylosanthes scabra TaxID=79078 RepID=A0ABU6ZMN0_9FABA|nr:hypothetical protein [Stylosanthes scabra]
MRIIIAALLGKINHWSKQTIWETNKGSLIKILMPTLTTPDGGITLTLVGEGTKIKEEATFKIVHLTLLSKDHHFLNQQPYHHHLNRNTLKLIPLKRLWRSSP